MDTRDLTAVLRDAVLDHLGPESVRVLAETMALPEDVAKALIDNPAWSLDLLARLIGDLGLTVEVRPGSGGPVVAEPEPEVEVAAVESLAESPAEPPPPDEGVAPRPVAVPRPPSEGALYATPPLERRETYYAPGDMVPETGKRFVHLSAHAAQRAEEMGIERHRVIKALQPENILSRRPDLDGKARLVESKTEPLLVFVTRNDDDWRVISVLWKSAEPYERPSCPIAAKRHPEAP